MIKFRTINQSYLESECKRWLIAFARANGKAVFTLTHDMKLIDQIHCNDYASERIDALKTLKERASND